MSQPPNIHMSGDGIVRITRDHPPRPITELWAWIIEENGGEGIAAIEMHIDGMPFMMPLVGADEERIRSLEPHAKHISERTGRPVTLRRFANHLPTREAIAQAIRGEPNAALGEAPWERLSDDRRADWLKDADRVLALIEAENRKP